MRWRFWRRPVHARPGARRLLVPFSGGRLDPEVLAAALRRLAALLGVHFLEEESDDVIGAVRAAVVERGTTYLYIGTPERRRTDEVLHGALLTRLIEALPGIDIRIAADRSRRRELHG